jgi:steroid Delta-isomerase
MSTMLTAQELGHESRMAVARRDKDGWLALFADDAVVEDPIGPSPLCPDGLGHRGKEAISAFYDTVIAPSEKITFEMHSSTLCANECADVGIIRTWLAGGETVAVVHCVFTYRATDDGRIGALRAFWRLDAMEFLPASSFD